MKVNIVSSDTAIYHVLALMPDTPGLPPLGHLDAKGELEFFKELKNLTVDALIGPVTQDQFTDALLAERYQILYIGAHGDPEGIALGTSYLPAEQLARIMAQLDIRIAVLMACKSDPYAKALADAGVDYVIAVKTDVDNILARQFARGFFVNLVSPGGVPAAYEWACATIPATDACQFTLYKAAPLDAEDADMREIHSLKLGIDRLITEQKTRQELIIRMLTEMASTNLAENRDMIVAVMALGRILSGKRD